MKIDDVAYTYFISKLFEMAKNSGVYSYSRINTNNNGYRNSMYAITKDYPIHLKISNDISIHKKEDDNSTHYATLNHNSGEILHHAIVMKNRASEEIPFDHEEQTIVDRIKRNDMIPKGHATDVIYNHFKNSELPLRSSGDQYLNGHKMWSRLIDKALSDGHHVSYYDEKTKENVNMTKENKEEYFKKYFGDSDVFEHRHIILKKNNN